jgi:hypothetical protein
MAKIEIIAIFCLCININVSYLNGLMTPLVPSENYKHSIDALTPSLPGQFVIYYKLIEPNVIQFESHVKTTGWVGIGISPDSMMDGSDMAIGWVKGSSTFLMVNIFNELCFLLIHVLSISTSN